MSPDLRPRLAIAGSLPPDENGPAAYLADMLPALEQLADLTLMVEHPSRTSPGIRARYPVVPLIERFDPSYDLVMYHIANNTWHSAVLDAAREGPPGLLVVHDVSLHHLEFERQVGRGHFVAYRQLLSNGHGTLGEELYERYRAGHSDGLPLERFLFDLYGDLLDRHLAAQVHSDYAAQLLQLRRPGFPVWQVPHYARPAAAALDAHARYGIPAGRVIVCHAGFITAPKQYAVLVQAFGRALRDGLDAHLLFLGQDDTRGHLDDLVAQLHLSDRVTVSGWTSEEDFERTIASIDVAVSLRWPHVGESSGTLSSMLAAGRAIVLEPLGTWAEVPSDAVFRCDLSRNAVTELSAALTTVISDAPLRARLGTRAREYASTSLDLDTCARRVIDVARQVAGGDRIIPSVAARRREAAVKAFLDEGVERLDLALHNHASDAGGLAGEGHTLRYHRTLATLPPARAHSQLVDLGSWPPLLRVINAVWGYDVHGTIPRDPLQEGPRTVVVPEAAGLPTAVVPLSPVDLQRDRLPYETGSVDVVTCWEVLEHLGRDPMHLLSEVNRVLKPSGLLHLTTPNAASAASVRSVLAGGPPGFWTHFTVLAGEDRHNREYTPKELRILLAAAGLSTEGVRTQAVWRDEESIEVREGLASLAAAHASLDDRDDDIVVLARKVGPVMDRYPAAFYDV